MGLEEGANLYARVLPEALCMAGWGNFIEWNG